MNDDDVERIKKAWEEVYERKGDFKFPKIEGHAVEIYGKANSGKPLFQCDYPAQEKIVMENMAKEIADVAELAIVKKSANPNYNLSDQEKASVAVSCGADFELQYGIHDSVMFEVKDVDVVWTGQEFMLMQRKSL